MATRDKVRLATLTKLFPSSGRPDKASEDVDFHLLSVLLILSTRSDVLNKVFPLNGPIDPQPLYDLGVDSTRAPVTLIAGLGAYRSDFGHMQDAWIDLSGYTNPPCPPNVTIQSLAAFTKTL